MGEMFGVVRTAFPQLRTMTCAENLPLHDAAALKVQITNGGVTYKELARVMPGTVPELRQLILLLMF